MTGDYVLVVEGMSSLKDIDDLDEKILLRAQQAINRTADRARVSASRGIRQELNFPAAYLRDRLTVRKRAGGGSLEAVIAGRDRPTSLARFVTNRGKKIGSAGVNVRVAQGVTKAMPRAFLMQLSNNNLGLAVRLKPGASLRNSRGAKRFSQKDGSLFLLYGPSVDQAFRTVLPEQGAEAAELLEREFLRLMGLDK